MITRVFLSAIAGAVGLYNLYSYVENSQAEFAYVYLVAGIACLIGSAHIFCSEDD